MALGLLLGRSVFITELFKSSPKYMRKSANYIGT